jgi:glucose repression mediator protein
MLAISHIHRSRDNFGPAVDFLKAILKVDERNGEVWGSLGKTSIELETNFLVANAIPGHCYLMLDNLQDAYSAYQQALYHLQDLKVIALCFCFCSLRLLILFQEPKLWYGIGILYDRYGSLEHAEEAFAQVMRMAPDFEKANEIYFRLGIIYKQQQKYNESLEVFFALSRLFGLTSLTIHSVSVTSSLILPNRLHRRTFGSKSAMYTSSRKM